MVDHFLGYIYIFKKHEIGQASPTSVSMETFHHRFELAKFAIFNVAQDFVIINIDSVSFFMI